MAENKMNAGYWAAQALVERGVNQAFFIAGGHIYPILDGLNKLGVNLVSTRHEQAAVFMAEAWGRMTRRPGVAVVTAGPGFTNALTPVANARLANSPLLVIAGVVGLQACEKLDLQDMIQLPVITPMVKKAFICHQADRIQEFVDMAYRTCISGRPGPVYLELPVDVMNMEVNPAMVRKTNTTPESRVVDRGKAAELIALMKEARKPVFIAGSGAYYSGAGAEFKEFIEMTGAPGFTSSQGRGVISDTEPLCFGAASVIRPGCGGYAIQNADLFVLFGNRISLYYGCGLLLPKNARIVQVDIEPEEIGRNSMVHLPVVSDIREFLGECNRLLEEQKAGPPLRAQYAPWVAELREKKTAGVNLGRLASESPKVPIHPARLAREIDLFMDREEDIVVGDGGDTQVWMGMFRTARKEGHYLESGLYGCLGVGIPYAIAAKLLHPQKRVLNVIGDGSVGFNFMEFETAIRKKIPIVVVISNDLGWGMIRHSSKLKLGRNIEEVSEIGQIHYEKFVESMGGVGIFVEKPEEIRPALEKAFASGKPACINVLTDPTAVGPGALALAMVSGYKVEGLKI
jgi:thiamine pyrophosphate-dependent acetolactate synthase large subunit-like protein